MNAANTPPWKPSQELLAAFADGELEGRGDSEELRARIEAWLVANPEAQADLAANRRLKALCDRTAPPMPSNEAWRETLNRVEQPPPPQIVRRRPTAALLVGAGAAAACLLWAFLLASNFWKRAPSPLPEAFVVAGEDDIEILHVEGDALDGLVVGLGSFQGALELADQGDVFVLSVTCAPRDNMKPVIDSDGPNRPVIWARANLDERFEWEEE
jgi:hypothetical protein